MPAIVRSNVDFPAPLRPITPSTVPRGTSNETSRSAGTSRSETRVRLNRSSSPDRHDVSRWTRYDAETFSTSTASARCAGCFSDEGSETECKGPLTRHEHAVSDDDEESCP